MFGWALRVVHGGWDLGGRYEMHGFLDDICRRDAMTYIKLQRWSCRLHFFLSICSVLLV
jgi:hypothetical protein